MGAFFLYGHHEKVNLEAALQVFSAKGFSEPVWYTLSGYTLAYYDKILTQTVNHYEDSEGSVFCCGTLIYQKHHNIQALKELLGDYRLNRLDPERLIGHFCLIFVNKEKIEILIDAAGTYNVYYHRSQKIISSSFLAILNATTEPASLNRMAVTEILCTGALIGPDTQVENIMRLEIGITDSVHDFKVLKLDFSEEFSSATSLDEEVDLQIARLDHYFSSVTDFCDEKGVMIGLTGGFDSRLLLEMVERHFRKTEYFTHWQSGKTEDFRIAGEIAAKIGKDLMLLKKHDVRNEPETKVLDQLENAFNFTDGNIRSQYYWHEIYNTPDYYQDIGFVNRVMLNGVGGEQYRNGEWINRSTSNFDTWIKNAVLFFQAGNPFRRSSEFSDFFAWYMEKIRRKLNIHSTRVNHLQIKRFLNEIYNPSLRTLRSNNENQLMFHLSPFTDWVVSSFAYRAVPFLGRSKEFQIRMIRRLNPEIASIRSSYGYPFSDDEPLKDLIFSGFFNLFPKNLLSTVGRIRSGGRICEWEKIPLLSSMADNFCQTLTEMSPALNTKYIRSNSALSPLLFQMEYFIRKMPNL